MEFFNFQYNANQQSITKEGAIEDNLFLKSAEVDLRYNYISFNFESSNIDNNVIDFTDYWIELLDENGERLHEYPVSMLSKIYLRTSNKRGIPMFKYSLDTKNVRIVKYNDNIVAGTKFIFNTIFIII